MKQANDKLGYSPTNSESRMNTEPENAHQEIFSGKESCEQMLKELIK